MDAVKAIDVIVGICKVVLCIGLLSLGIYFYTLGDPKLLIIVVSTFIGYIVLTEIIRKVVKKVLKEYKLIEK